MSTLHLVVPDAIDDPARPSGGNTYDRRLRAELESVGWSVHEYAVPGFWTRPDGPAFAALGDVLERIPNDAVALLDGLIASTAPDLLVRQAGRLRLVALVHMPLGHRPKDGDARLRERAALSAATAVITTSDWARRRLIELYALPAHGVHVAEPGAEAAKLATGTMSGGSLICVAAVTFEKGHDVLLNALDSVSDLSWSCLCIGRLDREPAFVESLRRRAAEKHVVFPGPRTGVELDRAYAAADVLVLASRAETYGMVVTEALARGLPVIATETGGLPDALGHGADEIRPGLLVPPEDPRALGGALRAWLCDAALRARLRRAARERRRSLAPWSTTASTIAAVLTEVSR